MRSAVLAICAAIMLSAPLGAAAQSEHRANGTVTNVDQGAERVTIAHEAIPGIKWPAMTMSFKVKDKALLERVKPGQKVAFALEKSGDEYVVTDIK
jgi:Cu/Ag efflux protein CusF